MNNRYYYLYKIVGLRIICNLPWEIEILEEAEEFLHPVKWDAEASAMNNKVPGHDLYIQVKEVNGLPYRPSQDAVFEQSRLYSKSGENVIMHMLKNVDCPPYACTVQNEEKGRFDCYILKENHAMFRYSRHFSDLIGMETVFLQFRTLMLHAAFIRWQGQGILFTAPSGTGKSTQAKLWEKYEHAETINGDRAGVRLEKSGWKVYGLPYAGSSGIYRNEAAPLTAIIALRQAGENKIRRLTEAEAWKLLYPETVIHRWDQDFTGQALDLLIQMVGQIPVYLLECRPERKAVNLVKNMILQ